MFTTNKTPLMEKAKTQPSAQPRPASAAAPSNYQSPELSNLLTQIQFLRNDFSGRGRPDAQKQKYLDTQRANLEKAENAGASLEQLQISIGSKDDELLLPFKRRHGLIPASKTSSL